MVRHYVCCYIKSVCCSDEVILALPADGLFLKGKDKTKNTSKLSTSDF